MMMMNSQTSSDLTILDFFCGMGGSSTGLAESGWNIRVAANHSQIAVSTHAANHPNTEHLCGDIQAIDLRTLPRARALWASPICTEVSPAGGRRKKGHHLDSFEAAGHVASGDFERTRVTFWEVVRAAELFRFEAVLIENVVEAAQWELFDIWLGAMSTLGYSYQFVSVNAAHVWGPDNPPAPQWRDRLYIVFLRNGIRQPDLEPRPLAWCPDCGTAVPAIQWWKPRKGQTPARRIGKYGPQYLYQCPVGHGIVEPFVAPAASAIDWTDLGTRIGDRDKPLSPATMRRIRVGLETIGNPALVAASGNTYDAASGANNRYLRVWPATTSPVPTQVNTAQQGIATNGEFVFSVTHGQHDTGRHFDPNTRPFSTATVKLGEALVVPAGGTWNTDARSALDEPHRTMLTRDAYGLALTAPFVTMLRNHGGALPVSDPLATMTASGFHHGLTVPDGAFISKHHGSLDYGPIGHMNKTVDEPMPTTLARLNQSLVIPYRKGSKAYGVQDGPLSTMATHEQHGVATITDEDVMDARFRMLKPREAANAQRFPGDYVIHGNSSQMQMQAGNAVAVNVAHWIGAQVAKVLDQAA